MSNHENAVAGTPGQAPVRPDVLRQMLHDAKSRADDAQEALTRSERMRADMANKMAAHADTIQMLSSLRELALEQGEGVLLYVRRPGDPQPYPVVVGKGELQSVEPENWWREIIDPRARAVLDAADRAKAWIPADPAADQRMREDYLATCAVLQIEKGGLMCEVAEKVFDLGRAAMTEVHSLKTTNGCWVKKIAELEARVGQLQAELNVARVGQDDEIEEGLVDDILAKHGAPKAPPAPDSGPEMANVAGPGPQGPGPASEEPEGEGVSVEERRERRVAKKRAKRSRAASKAKSRPASKARRKARPKSDPEPETGPYVPPEDGLGPDEPGDNRDSGRLQRGNYNEAFEKGA